VGFARTDVPLSPKSHKYVIALEETFVKFTNAGASPAPEYVKFAFGGAFDVPFLLHEQRKMITMHGIVINTDGVRIELGFG